MSYEVLRLLYCDGPRETCFYEDGAYSEGYGPQSTIKDQRRDAKRDGWLVAQPGGKDYCPRCRRILEEHNG